MEEVVGVWVLEGLGEGREGDVMRGLLVEEGEEGRGDVIVAMTDKRLCLRGPAKMHCTFAADPERVSHPDTPAVNDL